MNHGGVYSPWQPLSLFGHKHLSLKQVHSEELSREELDRIGFIQTVRGFIFH